MKYTMFELHISGRVRVENDDEVAALKQLSETLFGPGYIEKIGEIFPIDYRIVITKTKEKDKN